MQDDSLEGRAMMTNHMREMIYRNEQDMKNCTNTYGYRTRTPYQGTANMPKDNIYENNTSTGTFSLRLFLSLIILAGFVWFHMQDKAFLGYQSEQVVEAVSNSVNLQELAESVKINP